MIALKQKRQEIKTSSEVPLSQAKLAQLADLHPSTISNIETGNLKPWKGQRDKIEAAMKEAGWDGQGDLFAEVTE